MSPLSLSSLPLITLNLFHHSIHSLSHSRTQFVKARLQPSHHCMIYQISIMIYNSGERRFLSIIHNKLVFWVNENLLMNNVAYLVLVRLTQQLYRERERIPKKSKHLFQWYIKGINLASTFWKRCDSGKMFIFLQQGEETWFRAISTRQRV